MKKITYEIKDPQGLHARPAGMLVKKIAGFTCKIAMSKGEKQVDAKKIIALMSLCIKKGEKITVVFEGEDEAKAATEVEQFLKDNL